MIVKCQRSLETTEPSGPQILFYNEARDWYLQCPITDEWAKLFGKTLSQEDNRFFAEVKWPSRHLPPTFVRKLPEQHW